MTDVNPQLGGAEYVEGGSVEVHTFEPAANEDLCLYRMDADNLRTEPIGRGYICAAPEDSPIHLAHPQLCGAEYVTGGSDPYATECDLTGHSPTTPHAGDDPFGGSGRVEWRGGGSAGGDAIPYRDVRWINATPTN